MVVDPAIRSGKACVKGTRITVYDILECLAGGMSEDDVLRDFQGLARDEVRAALEFAAARERRLAGRVKLALRRKPEPQVRRSSSGRSFRQRAFLPGPPPKVGWLSVGNAGADAIASLVRARLPVAVSLHRRRRRGRYAPHHVARLRQAGEGAATRGGRAVERVGRLRQNQFAYENERVQRDCMV